MRPPALTVNHYGKGKAYYVGTRLNEAFYKTFLKKCLQEQGVTPIMETEQGIEITKRYKEQNSYLFALNHTDKDKTVQLSEQGTDILHNISYKAGDEVILKAKEVLILESKR